MSHCRVRLLFMLLLVTCYDNKMVKLPGVSSIGMPHMQLTNTQNILYETYIKVCLVTILK